jgi:hypothetical protein
MKGNRNGFLYSIIPGSSVVVCCVVFIACLQSAAAHTHQRSMIACGGSVRERAARQHAGAIIDHIIMMIISVRQHSIDRKQGGKKTMFTKVLFLTIICCFSIAGSWAFVPRNPIARTLAIKSSDVSLRDRSGLFAVKKGAADPDAEKYWQGDWGKQLYFKTFTTHSIP